MGRDYVEDLLEEDWERMIDKMSPEEFQAMYANGKYQKPIQKSGGWIDHIKNL